MLCAMGSAAIHGAAGALGGGISGGLNAAYYGGNVGEGALSGAAHGAASAVAFDLLASTADYMRSEMIKQSKLDPRNVNLNWDGYFKLDGGRYDPNPGYENSCSPLGCQQSGPGSISLFGFRIPYEPNSLLGRITRAFSGPHDYLNSTYWYDPLNGFIKQGMSMNERIVGEVFVNYPNVIFAAPFALAGAVRAPALSVAYTESMVTRNRR